MNSHNVIDGYLLEEKIRLQVSSLPSVLYNISSDEGIKKIMELDDMEFDEFDPYHVSHLDGAKWMRDKIQGGNNEQL